MYWVLKNNFKGRYIKNRLRNRIKSSRESVLSANVTTYRVGPITCLQHRNRLIPSHDLTGVDGTISVGIRNFPSDSPPILNQYLDFSGYPKSIFFLFGVPRGVHFRPQSQHWRFPGWFTALIGSLSAPAGQRFLHPAIPHLPNVKNLTWCPVALWNVYSPNVDLIELAESIIFSTLVNWQTNWPNGYALHGVV